MKTVKIFCCSTVSAALPAKVREKPRNGRVPLCWRSCAEPSARGHPLSRRRDKPSQHISLEALNVVSEKVDDFHVEREGLQQDVAEQLGQHKVVSIGGLPGCGKSAVLKRFAQKKSTAGPMLFLKNDCITGTGWSTFAASLGLSNTDAVQLLLEIVDEENWCSGQSAVALIRPARDGFSANRRKTPHNKNVDHQPC